MVEVDTHELILNILKYLFQGFAIALVAHLLDMIGPNKLNGWEISILAVTSACVFAILDVISPTFSQSAQQGVGLATGFRLMNFPS
jgi:hypothetical protein